MDDLRARITKIAGDFVPDRDADAPLALAEMRCALLEALEDTKATPEVSEALAIFVAHYPHGINPYLDDAHRKARAALQPQN